jgi:hypothetical protein
MTQALVATPEGPISFLGVRSKQGMKLVESGQDDAPTEGGKDTHGATDDDGDDGEDDDDGDDDDAGLPTNAPLLEQAATDIFSIATGHIVVL